MSASTRTVQQQSLGNGQIWAALAVVTMALIVALVFAFSLRVDPKAPATSSAVGNPPPAVIDHGWSQAGTSRGVQSTPVDHGSSEGSMNAAGAAGAKSAPGFRGDPGFAPRTTIKVTSGNNGTRLAQ